MFCEDIFLLLLFLFTFFVIMYATMQGRRLRGGRVPLTFYKK